MDLRQIFEMSIAQGLVIRNPVALLYAQEV